VAKFSTCLGLRKRISLVSKSLWKDVPTSFIELRVDREPAAALVAALRASAETLRHLRLTPAACEAVVDSGAGPALEAASRVLRGPVAVEVVRTMYDPDAAFEHRWVMDYEPAGNLLRVAQRLFAGGHAVVSFALPTAYLLYDDMRKRATWELYESVFGDARRRLRLSDVQVNVNYLDQLIARPEHEAEHDDDAPPAYMAGKTVSTLALIARCAAIRTATVVVGLRIDLVREFVGAVQASELRLFFVQRVGLARELGLRVAGNAALRSLELHFGSHDEELGLFDFAAAALLHERGFPDGVVVSVFDPDHPVREREDGIGDMSTGPLTEALRSLRVGARLSLDLAYVAWRPETMAALQHALVGNATVSHLQLTISHGLIWLNGFDAFALPGHVTSASFSVTYEAFAFFVCRVALPEVVVLDLAIEPCRFDFTDHESPLVLAGVPAFLRGAPKLERLTLRTNGHFALMFFLVKAVHAHAPRGCAVDLSFDLWDRASPEWMPTIAALVKGGRHAWTIRAFSLGGPSAVLEFAASASASASAS